MPIYKTGKKQNGIAQYRVTYNFTDFAGNYKQKSRLVYGSELAKQTELQLMYQSKQTANPQKMTLNELYYKYIDSKQHEVRESTLRKSESVIKNNILPMLGDVRLDKLTVPILQDWKNKIAATDKMIRTKQNAYTEFRALLNYAEKMEYLPNNPILKIGNFKNAYSFHKAEDKIQYYTPQEFKQFITAAQSHNSTVLDYAFYTFFNIAFYTGMRKGEINALRWSDINGNILSVSRSVNQKLPGKPHTFTPPKNASSVRKLQIPKPLKDILNKQMKIQQKAYKEWNPDYLVCGGPECLSDTSISNRNIQYAKEAELHQIRIHDFRHTHATVLVNEGINIQEIARRLGHADVNVTWKTYAHLYPREEERAVKLLESLF